MELEAERGFVWGGIVCEGIPFKQSPESGEGPNFQFSAGSKDGKVRGPISPVIKCNNQHMIGSRYKHPKKDS